MCYTPLVLDIYISLCLIVQYLTVYFWVSFRLTQIMFVGKYYKTKTIIHCWHTNLSSTYIRQCGLINVSCVILMWCWIYTYPYVWQYQTTQYIFEYQFASFTVCLWANATKQNAIIHCWHTKLYSYYIRQCGLINVSCVILMLCWICTYPCVW